MIVAEVYCDSRGRALDLGGGPTPIARGFLEIWKPLLECFDDGDVQMLIGGETVELQVAIIFF